MSTSILGRRHGRELLDATALGRTLDRMALEILEKNGGVDGLALVGIHRGGVPLAARLQERIRRHSGSELPLGMVDITLYRDDAATSLPQPIVGETALPFDLVGRRIVLVDDVLFTGRTVRCALDELMDFGRPERIQLAVLVDRGRRELPIHADVVGLTVSTEATQQVEVALSELGALSDAVTLWETRAP